MSTISTICLIIILTAFPLYYSERIQYITTERPSVTYYSRKYYSHFNVTSRRYGRRDPFYYVSLHLYSNYEAHNNWTIDFYFYEFLSNRYRRGFVEMHFTLCDLIEKDQFFGTALRQGLLANASCPFPAGAYHMNNMTIPLKNIPKNFPFTKGRIYVNVTSTDIKELIFSGHIDMEIKEGHITTKNWVDKQ